MKVLDPDGQLFVDQRDLLRWIFSDPAAPI